MSTVLLYSRLNGLLKMDNAWSKLYGDDSSRIDVSGILFRGYLYERGMQETYRVPTGKDTPNLLSSIDRA